MDPPPLRRGRLRARADAPATGERSEVLSEGPGWRIEEILSGALPAPVEDLLDHVEWVLVVEGGAELEVDGRQEHLSAGDWIEIGPGNPHRVLSTDPGTRWLAVHVALGPAQ